MKDEKEGGLVLDSTYIAEVNARIKLIPQGWSEGYRFEFDGWNDPPLKDIVSMLDSGSDSGVTVEMKEELLRKMISGKTVKVSFRGKELGSFALNDGMMPVVPGQPPVRTPFESFPVLRENPTAFRQLLSLAVSAVMEKCLPPQIATPPAAAQLPTLRSRKSSEGQG